MKWSRLLLLLCLGAVLALAACGGDDDDESAAPPSQPAAEQGEGKAAAQDVATTPPTEIQVTQALEKAPPQGKRVIFLQCELPACARYKGGAEAATKALGWTTDFQVFKNTAPASALSLAVSQKPDYIFISGIPPAVLKQPLAAAAKADIPVFSAADPATPKEGEYAYQVGGTLVPDAENVGKWIINDSGGKANVVAVTIPQFPVLNGETDWFKSEFTKLCSGCAYDQLDVTVEEVGAGGVPQKLVGYLQSHPDVNYIFFTFSDLGKGVGKVLEGAGLRDKIKLTGCCGDSGIAKEIVSGDTDAWTIAPNEYSAMAAYDGMARHAVGMDLAATAETVYESPSWVVDSPESVNKYLKPTGFDWPGPANFEQKFQDLWQVGSGS